MNQLRSCGTFRYKETGTVIANQLNIEVVGKESVGIDMAVPEDNNIRMMEEETLSD